MSDWKAKPWSYKHPYGLVSRQTEEELSEASTKEGKRERDEEAVRLAVDKKEPWLSTIEEEPKQKQKKRVRFVENLRYNQQKFTEKETKNKENNSIKLAYKFAKNKLKFNKHEFASNYLAIDSEKNFGLIFVSSDYNQVILTAHARKSKDPECVLRLCPGDTIKVLTRHGEEGQLKVEFTSRSRYFSPGQVVRSVTLGVRKMDWDLLQV